METEKQHKIRANYVKDKGKWIRRMEYFDTVKNKWEEFNNIDWYHMEKIINGS